MLFHVFGSQGERRAFGGSAFMELLFCRLPIGTRAKKLVATRSIKGWQDDSLYVSDDDIDLFYREYGHIFNSGVYGNLKSGTVDIFGVNYYAPHLIDSIIESTFQCKPTDYEILIRWLNKAKEYNGFYILGI